MPRQDGENRLGARAASVALCVGNYAANTLMFQTYVANFIIELLEILSRPEYGLELSESMKREKIPAGILGFSALSMLAATIINHYRPTSNAVHHLLLLPSVSVLFFLMDLVANITNYNAMSLTAFIAISAVAIPLAVLLFIKFEAPDMREKGKPYYLEPFRSYPTPTFAELHPDGVITKTDRTFNIFCATHYCFRADIALFFALNRELSATGETTPMAPWQYGATLVALLRSAVSGYSLTEDARSAQAFVADMKMLIAGAYIYEALGGILNLFFTLHCAHDQFCASRETQDQLSWESLLISAVLALLVRAETAFDVGRRQRTNRKIQRYMSEVSRYCGAGKNWTSDHIDDAQRVVVDECAQVPNKVRGMLSWMQNKANHAMERLKRKWDNCCVCEETGPLVSDSPIP